MSSRRQLRLIDISTIRVGIDIPLEDIYVDDNGDIPGTYIRYAEWESGEPLTVPELIKLNYMLDMGPPGKFEVTTNLRRYH